MAVSNRERVGQGMELLRAGLEPFVEREFLARLGERWFDSIRDHSREPLKRGADGKVVWDNQALLKGILDQWQAVFHHTLGNAHRTLARELIDVRNSWAHEKPFSTDDTYRALDSIQRLLEAISAPQAAEVDRQKQELLRTSFAEKARGQVRYATALAEGQPEKGLRPWRELTTPHPDVQSGRYQQAEFAADLAQVRRGEGSDEYRDPKEFFRRTYLTLGLRDLLQNALRRLSGHGGDPAVELQTNFGGGKTHSMLALFHLCGPTKLGDLPGLEPLLKETGVLSLPGIRRAVLVGTELSPGQPHVEPDGTAVRTLWGELAHQLGGAAGYAMVAGADQTGTSPGSRDLKALLDRHAPCLILIDEWVAYARQLRGVAGLPGGSFEAQASFAQSLTEAVKAVPKALLVASVPSSRIEVGGDNGDFALESLRNVFERLGATWKPASAEEGFEIVRRRLFEPIGPEAAPGRDAVVNAFARMYHQSKQEFPQGCDESSYKDRLLAAYPIHPELFDRLYGEWSALDKFQRTRGVLRLMAAVIHSLWERDDKSLVILPSSVPIDDPQVTNELTRYLDDNWTPILERDVDGPQSVPLALDRDNPNLGRYSACRRVARTIYLGSAPTYRGPNPGIDDRSVKLGCVQPGEHPATFGDALRRLPEKTTYLNSDGTRSWYSTVATVARVAQDRAAQQDIHRVWERLRAQLLAEGRSRGELTAVHVCPDGPEDVPDEKEARMVVLGQDFPHTARAKESAALKQAQLILDHRGQSPRLYRNALVFVTPDQKQLAELEAALRMLMAWESVVEDSVALNLDEFQKKQAARKLDEAEKGARARVRETYVHLLIPGQGKPDEPLKWEEARVPEGQGDEALAVRASRKLVAGGQLLPRFGAPNLKLELDRYLWQQAPHLTMKQLWEYFAAYPYLPRLKEQRTLLDAVQDGLSRVDADQLFAYAQAFDDGSGRYLGLQERGVAGVDQSGLLVRPHVARAQLTAEATASGNIGGAVIDGQRLDAYGPSGDPVSPAAPSGSAVGVRTFVGSIALDGDRIGRDASRVADEVLQHLSTLKGAKVSVTLEIQVHTQEAIPEKVVRTVEENCRTLHFKTQTFEK